MKEKVLRIDRPAAGGFLSLTALWAEGCGGGFAANYKKGRGWRRRLCRRVVFASAQGATAPAALRVVVSPFGAQRTHFEEALATRKM